MGNPGESHVTYRDKGSTDDGVAVNFLILSQAQRSLREAGRKAFVGAVQGDVTAHELQRFFGQYAEVADIFIPKPLGAIVFVTFAEDRVAHTLPPPHLYVFNVDVLPVGGFLGFFCVCVCSF